MNKLLQKFAHKAPASSKAPAGFNLVKPPTHFFSGSDVSKLYAAAKEQSDSMAIVDVTPGILDGVSLTGDVGDTDYVLSQAAFSDLCHFAKIPVQFIKNLAKYDGQQACDVVATMLHNVFHIGPAKQFVVDAPSRRVEGIVGKGTYKPLSNADALDYAVTAAKELEVAHGWICGPYIRVVVTTPYEIDLSHVSKGDVVRAGMSIENAVNGDQSVRVRDYCHRVLGGGMCAADGAHGSVVRHVGDVKFNVQKAVVESAKRTEEILPLIHAAASHAIESAAEVHEYKKFLIDPANHGSVDVYQHAANHAKEMAGDEGEVTHWGMIAGVADAAAQAKTLPAKIELEGLAFKTLLKFGVKLLG